MRRAGLAALGLVVVMAAAFAGMVRGTEAGATETPSVDRVAIVEFDNGTGEASLDRLATEAEHWISAALQEIGAIEVVDLPDLLEAGVDPADPVSAARLVHSVGAGTAVVGSVRSAGAEPTIEISVIDARERDSAYALRAMAFNAGEPQVAAENVRQWVAGTVAFHADGRFSGLPRSRRSPSTLDAYHAMVAGFEHLARFESLAATEAFGRAAALDPGFLLADVLRLEALLRANRSDELRAATAALAARRAEMDDWEIHVTDHYEAIVHRDWVRAFDAARTAAALAPGSFSARLHGQAAVRVLRLDEAAAAFERLDPEDPWARSFPEYFWLLGDVYHFLQRYEDELRISRRGREIRDHPLLLRNELRARVALGEVEEVVGELEGDLMVRDVSRAPFHLTLEISSELARRGRPAEARHLRERLLDWFDALPEEEQGAYLGASGRGRTLYALRHHEEALPWLRRAAQHVASPMDLGYLGASAASLGRSAEAREARERLNAHIDEWEGPTPLAWFSLARIEAMAGDDARSAYLLERARVADAPASLSIVNRAHFDDAFDGAVAAHPTLAAILP